MAKYNDSSDTWIWAVGFGTTSADKTELIDPVATSRGTVLVALQTTGGNVYMDTTVVLTANNGDTVQAIVELDAATGELVQYVRIVTSSSDLLSAGLVEAGNNFYFAGYHQATLTTSNGLSIPFGSGFQDNTYLLRLNSSTLLPEIVTTMRGSSAVNIRTLRVASTSPLTFAAGGTNHARPLTIQTPNGDETWVTTQDPSNARDSAVTFILNSDLLVIHKAVLGRAIKGVSFAKLSWCLLLHKDLTQRFPSKPGCWPRTCRGQLGRYLSHRHFHRQHVHSLQDKLDRHQLRQWRAGLVPHEVQRST